MAYPTYIPGGYQDPYQVMLPPGYQPPMPPGMFQPSGGPSPFPVQPFYQPPEPMLPMPPQPPPIPSYGPPPDFIADDPAAGFYPQGSPQNMIDSPMGPPPPGFPPLDPNAQAPMPQSWQQLQGPMGPSPPGFPPLDPNAQAPMPQNWQQLQAMGQGPMGPPPPGFPPLDPNAQAPMPQSWQQLQNMGPVNPDIANVPPGYQPPPIPPGPQQPMPPQQMDFAPQGPVAGPQMPPGVPPMIPQGPPATAQDLYAGIQQPGAFQPQGFEFDPKAALNMALLQGGAAMMGGANLQEGLAAGGQAFGGAMTQQKQEQQEEQAALEQARRQGYEDEWREYSTALRNADALAKRQDDLDEKAIEAQERMEEKEDEQMFYDSIVTAHGLDTESMTAKQRQQKANDIEAAQKAGFRAHPQAPGMFIRHDAEGNLETKSLWTPPTRESSTNPDTIIQREINEIQQATTKVEKDLLLQSRRQDLDKLETELAGLRGQPTERTKGPPLQSQIRVLRIKIQEAEAEAQIRIADETARIRAEFSGRAAQSQAAPTTIAEEGHALLGR